MWITFCENFTMSCAWAKIKESVKYCVHRNENNWLCVPCTVYVAVTLYRKISTCATFHSWSHLDTLVQKRQTYRLDYNLSSCSQIRDHLVLTSGRFCPVQAATVDIGGVLPYWNYNSLQGKRRSSTLPSSRQHIGSFRCMIIVSPSNVSCWQKVSSNLRGQEHEEPKTTKSSKPALNRVLADCKIIFSPGRMCFLNYSSNYNIRDLLACFL